MRRFWFGLLVALMAGSASAAPVARPYDAAPVVRAIEHRLSVGTLDRVRQYGRDALQLKGRERLRRLFAVALQLGDISRAADAGAWNARLREIARQEGDRRYQRLSQLIEMNGSAMLHPTTAAESFMKAFGADPDWMVRAMAMTSAAKWAACEGDKLGSLLLLEKVRTLVPADDPDRHIVLGYDWLQVAYAFALLRDPEHVVPALEASEHNFAQTSAPNAISDALQILVAVGLTSRDETLARLALGALTRVSSESPGGALDIALLQSCAVVEHDFGTPEGVLKCSAGRTVAAATPTLAYVGLQDFRALAYAKLGRTGEAKRILAELDAITRRDHFAGAPDSAELTRAWIDRWEGRAAQGFDRASAYWRNAEMQTIEQNDEEFVQLRKSLARELDLSRRNEQQQQTIILFQWVMGAAAAVLCAAAIGVLVWQRRLNRQLQAARQRAEDANALKSQFLANVSHEVRTPLNGVLGMIQAIAADELSPIQRERLEVLRGSSRGMLTILNDLLDLAKIEAGKLSLESLEFDLAPVVEGSRHAFWAAAEAKGLALELTVEGQARGLYRGDPTRLRQVVDNLVSNAIKFTSEGGVHVTFAPLGAGEGLRLTVRDTGIGMTPEAAAKIFSKFEQADASTTRKYGGTGLGLSICRELVHAFGGEITVSSTPGEGTTFTAELPLPRIGDSPAPGAEAAGAEAAGLDEAGEGLRILAAEDHPVNQLVLRTLLSQLGCEVTMVGDGAQAVEAFRTARWDVLLMDIQMPVMDGIEAARTIRGLERAQGMARTPLVALTANAMMEQIAEYRAAGFDDHLAKPIDAGDLLAVLNRALAGYGEAPEMGEMAVA